MNSKLALSLVALGLAGCASKEPSSPKPAPTQDPLARNPGSLEELPPVDAPMSQDEADANAAKQIQKDNADAELEKLKKELSGG
ncbi:MAG: hypothetical protein ABI054_07430 [Planctomycetota bacterium]